MSAGILGIIFYAIASGIPIMIVAFLGDILQTRLPGILSLSDYTYKRFGRYASLPPGQQMTACLPKSFAGTAPSHLRWLSSS